MHVNVPLFHLSNIFSKRVNSEDINKLPRMRARYRAFHLRCWQRAAHANICRQNLAQMESAYTRKEAWGGIGQPFSLSWDSQMNCSLRRNFGKRWRRPWFCTVNASSLAHPGLDFYVPAANHWRPPVLVRENNVPENSKERGNRGLKHETF